MRFASFIVGLLLSLLCRAETGPAPAMVSACFTPGPDSCADLIADQLNAARSVLRVQAYYVTSPRMMRGDVR